MECSLVLEEQVGKWGRAQDAEGAGGRVLMEKRDPKSHQL